MPSGKREVFTIRLKTDRHQRKALDGFVARANDAANWAFLEQRESLSAGVPKNLEELVDAAAREHDLHRETLVHACELGLRRLTAVLGGEIGERRRPTTLFAIPGSSVIFSVFERLLSVPHVGACSFKGNMFALKSMDGTDAKQLAMDAYRVELGYYNNEPVIMVDTVDRTEKPKPAGEQRLVKVVRKPKVTGEGAGGAP